MDNLIHNGDMVLDHLGGVQSVTGIQEVIQRVMIRLTMRQGAFVYDTALGSRLYQMDIHQTDEFTLLAVIRDALSDMQEVSVIGVEKNVDYEEQVLYLTVYIQVNGQDAILELNRKIWNE